MRLFMYLTRIGKLVTTQFGQRVAMMSYIILLLCAMILTVQSIYLPNQEGFACPIVSNSHSIVQSQNINVISYEKDNLLIGTKNDSLFPDLFNPKTFTNSTLGFRIDYPFDWSYNIFNNGVIFRSPAGVTPTSEESVKVSTGTNYSTYLIEPYLHPVKEQEENLFNNGSTLVVTPIIVSGQPAIKNQFISLRMLEGPCPPPFPVQQNITDIYLTDGKTIFTIEYESGFTPAMAPTIEKMLDSFKIIK